jgi:hypothetical protein
VNVSSTPSAGQPRELEVRAPKPARQRDPLLQVLCRTEPGGPALRVAEADQDQRAQFLAERREVLCVRVEVRDANTGSGRDGNITAGRSRAGT